MDVGLLFGAGEASAAAASRGNASRSTGGAATPGFEKALQQELGRASGETRSPDSTNATATTTGTSSEACTQRVQVNAAGSTDDAAPKSIDARVSLETDERATVELAVAPATPDDARAATEAGAAAAPPPAAVPFESGPTRTSPEAEARTQRAAPFAERDETVGADAPAPSDAGLDDAIASLTGRHEPDPDAAAGDVAPDDDPGSTTGVVAFAVAIPQSGPPEAPEPARTSAGESAPRVPVRESPVETAPRSAAPVTDPRETDSAPAAGPAPSAAEAPPRPGPDVAVRSLDQLAPRFRDRLERVVQRLQDELGLDVRVVETWRSQERQDRLWAQGRTAPGPVVTWTRSSNHTQGTAADIAVDGPADEAAAYRQLARVAAEEGLRTLGPDDPGHVELADGAPARSASAVSDAGEGSAPAGIARVARVASVAGVARVASVAAPGTASRARAASSAPATLRSESPVAAVSPVPEAPPAPTVPSALTAEPAPVDADAMPSPAPAASASAFDRSAGAEQVIEETIDSVGPSAAKAAARKAPRESRADEPSALELPVNPSARGAATADGGAVRAAADPSPAAVPEAAPPASPLSATSGPDIAERVARVLMLRDAAAAAPATGVTMMLDGADGAAARIRLALRGNAVGATIDTTDAVEALDLAGRTGELQRVLEKHGLETGRLVVREAAGLASDARVNTIDAANTWLRSGGEDGRRPSQDGSQPHWRDAGTADTRQQRRNPKEERK